MSSSNMAGTIIKEIRTSRSESQADLAKVVGTTPNTVSRWETGQYKPSVEDLWKISEHYKVSVARFFPRNTAPRGLNLVSNVHICDQCLDGAGGECHTPGCILFLNRGPDIPIRDSVLLTSGTIEPLGSMSEE